MLLKLVYNILYLELGMACHILVLGHSFVNRLQQFSRQQQQHNLDLDAKNFHVSYLGISGLTLKRAFWQISAIDDLKPDAIFLDVGANDLDHTAEPDADFLAADVVEFANSLLLHTKFVYITSAFHRLKPRRSDYERVLPAFNDTLRRACRGLQNVAFWPHRNMTLDWQKYMAGDGVHLNNEGLRKYARSIRGAALKARTNWCSI